MIFGLGWRRSLSIMRSLSPRPWRGRLQSFLRRLVRFPILLSYGIFYLRLDIGWDDVGDFSSLADLLPAEANQPRILGDSNLGTSSLFRSIPLEADLSMSSS